MGQIQISLPDAQVHMKYKLSVQSFIKISQILWEELYGKQIFPWTDRQL